MSEAKTEAVSQRQVSGLAFKVLGAVLSIVGTGMVSLLFVVWGEVSTVRHDVSKRLTEVEKADIRHEAQMTILKGKQEQLWANVGDRYTSQQAAAEGRVLSGLIEAVRERVAAIESRLESDGKLGTKVDRLIRTIEARRP